VVRKLYDALQDGLDDYTIDERGDVGSWIRIACIKGLTSFSEILFAHAGVIPDFKEYLPISNFHQAIGGILKQGVERLDSVRQEAGVNINHLLSLPVPVVAGGESWRIYRHELMRELFLRYIIFQTPICIILILFSLLIAKVSQWAGTRVLGYSLKPFGFWK
jgi:tubulin-specific chaperone D